MTALAILLITLSVGDLLSGGLSGEPAENRRTVLATVSAALVAAALVWLLDSGMMQRAALGGIVSLVVAAWLWCRNRMIAAEKGNAGSRAGASRGWAMAALGVLGLACLLAVVFAEAAAATLPMLDHWADGFPISSVRLLQSSQLLLVIAAGLFLSASSNSIVRLVLTTARTDWQTSQQTLRGGRYIGALERWLIFGLALSGEPTAAALIVSAKSLLRFPELNRKRDLPVGKAGKAPNIDEVTEYFLLGSLTSWALALALVLPLR